MSARIASLILALVFLTGQQPVRSQSKGSANGFDLVDKTGNIRKPADVRDRYQALGVYTPVDLNNNTEMHYTYASPGTAENYRKTGKFADGTVLVKEVFATDHAQLITRKTAWAATSRRRRQTGSMCKVTRSSNRSERKGSTETHF